jgi:hypothetical protein
MIEAIIHTLYESVFVPVWKDEGSPRGTRKREVPLTEAGIYAAALRLIDADGVEALTMRKLATPLDANPMSLYHHVPNKDAVLRRVTRTAGTQFRTVTPEDAPVSAKTDSPLQGRDGNRVFGPTPHDGARTSQTMACLTPVLWTAQVPPQMAIPD